MTAGSPRLAHSAPTTYPIVGRRDARPFSACSTDGGVGCESILVHRFAIACDGQTVPWATVAASASALGVELPVNLPAGYAPIAGLRGRIVLPGFGQTTRLPAVSRQFLSPDDVIVDRDPQSSEATSSWVTVVSPSESFVSWGGIATGSAAIAVLALGLFATSRAFTRRRRAGGADNAALEGDLGHLINSVALAKARIAQTEMIVSSLASGLALRSVLQSELDGLRKRADDVAQRGKTLAPERAGAMLRGLTRDLDRIARIAKGAGEQPEGDEQFLAASPSTTFEAYRVLGLNAEAPQAAVKKVVDALRMSWHPDHAQNEPDRLYREQRIKQINAAWDILKGNGAGQVAAA
nr:J domain-containing protein [Hyphomicrobium methylovorum]